MPVATNRKRSSAGRDDYADLLTREQRRRTSAKVDRVDGGVRLRRALNLKPQRLDILLLETLVQQSAIEVAVIADGRAEGDVEVETEHYCNCLRFQFPVNRSKNRVAGSGLSSL